jgi:hypothetical protein
MPPPMMPAPAIPTFWIGYGSTSGFKPGTLRYGALGKEEMNHGPFLWRAEGGPWRPAALSCSLL